MLSLHRMLNSPLLSSLYSLLSNLTALSVSSSPAPIYLLLCCHLKIRSSISFSPIPKTLTDLDIWSVISPLHLSRLVLVSSYPSSLPFSNTTSPPCPWQLLLHHLAPLCLPPLCLALYITVLDCDSANVYEWAFLWVYTWLCLWRRVCASVWTVSLC